MNKTPKYFIVEAEALPEIFLKVSQAKGLLETGEASTVNQLPHGRDQPQLLSTNIKMRCAPSTT